MMTLAELRSQRKRRQHDAHLVQPGRYVVSSRSQRTWFAVDLVGGHMACECGQLDCSHIHAVRLRLERCRIELSAVEAA